MSEPVVTSRLPDLIALAEEDSSEKRRTLLRELTGSALLAWDPVRQQEAWRVPQDAFGNGGVLATGGGLLFQGTADGRFAAHAPDTGAQLWSYATQNGTGAARTLR